MDKTRMTELARQASEGSKEAFSELYSGCSGPLKKYVIKLGAAPEEAEDVVSAAFVKAMESIASLREPAYFDTWLHTIAKNEFLSQRSREGRAVRVDIGGEDDTNEGVDIAAYNESAEEDTLLLPADYAENEDVKRIIAEAVNSLSEEQRDTVFLYYYDELTTSKIAERMNVPEGTVKSRLNSARSSLRRRLDKLQRQGVALCAVPMGSILAFAENSSGKAAAATAATSAAASGKMIAAAVMAVVVGTTGTLIYFNGRNNRLKGDDRPTDSLIVESIDDSSRDMTSTTTTTTTPAPVIEPEVTEDASSEDSAPPTTTTPATTAAPAAPRGTAPAQTAQGNDVPAQEEENTPAAVPADNVSRSVQTEVVKTEESEKKDSAESKRSTTGSTAAPASEKPEPELVLVSIEPVFGSVSSGWNVIDGAGEPIETGLDMTADGISLTARGGFWLNFSSVLGDDWNTFEDIDTSGANLNVIIVPKNAVAKGDMLFTYGDDSIIVEADKDYSTDQRISVKIDYNAFWGSCGKSNWESGCGTIFQIGNYSGDVTIYVDGVTGRKYV
ncbi:MAG: RNA polymerase sigma factor [Ruminococcus sp.]|nr:RNA polymerase sigma factor [Ruminococcus sp.]